MNYRTCRIRAISIQIFYIVVLFCYIATCRHGGVNNQSDVVMAWEVCPGDDDATTTTTTTLTTNLCPDSNLCCHGQCLSGDRGSAESSICCKDGTTGCREGFICGTMKDRSSTTHHQQQPMCVAIDTENDKLPSIIPRYQLCTVTANMTFMYGLPIKDILRNPQQQQHQRLRPSMMPDETDGTPVWVAPYLSTHGPVHDNDDKIFHHVRHAIILIHGSLRNADDYICCTSAAIPKDTAPNSVLILVPWFVAPEDGPINITTTTTNSQQQPTRMPPTYTAVRWISVKQTNDNDDDDDDDVVVNSIGHTWRYGAPSIDASAVSSFDVVDHWLRTLQNKVQFPSLQQIVVTGHSAGGQFVQRWALLSSVIPSSSSSSSMIPVRMVVANPKSYAYLDARRWVQYNHPSDEEDDELIFRVPSKRIRRTECPTYNEYIWGLNNSTALHVPYFYTALEESGGVDAIVERYRTRHVIYLSGESDILYNGDCEAKQQGPNRLIRSQRFFASLREIYNNGSGSSSSSGDNSNQKDAGKKHLHRRWTVPHVHHDHCLMFQSQQGQLALFGGPEVESSDDNDGTTTTTGRSFGC